VFYCYTHQELHVLQAQNEAPCSIVILPRNCTYCSLRTQHRVLLIHSPGTAPTGVSEPSTMFYCYTSQEQHVQQSESAAPCSIFTLQRTARTAVSERSTVFYCYTPQELNILQSENAAPCSIVTLPKNCTYCRLRAQHRVLLLHSPRNARTAF